MDQVRRCNRASAAAGVCRDRELTKTAASFHHHRKRSRAILLRLIPCCLAALLGSVAVDQPRADNGLTPQDTERSDTSAQPRSHRSKP